MKEARIFVQPQKTTVRVLLSQSPARCGLVEVRSHENDRPTALA